MKKEIINTINDILDNLQDVKMTNKLKAEMIYTEIIQMGFIHNLSNNETDDKHERH